MVIHDAMYVRLRPEGSTHGNRCVPLSGSQFLETQSKARKTFDILAFFFFFKKNRNPIPNLMDILKLRNFLTLEILPKIRQSSV